MNDELRDEYEFDYRRAKPNRFAAVLNTEDGAGESESGEEAEGIAEGQLRPADIVDEVRGVLAAAHRGKGDRPTYLTALQILARLSETTRARLIDERTGGGHGTGKPFAATGVVSRAARMAGAEVEYLDSDGLSVEVAGQPVFPGYKVCGVYRLPAEESAAT